MMNYQEHRDEFRKLQEELDAIDADESLSFEEYKAKSEDILTRRIEWYERDKSF